uniref:1,2-phenylacetyl-CoA epoxidase subunit PaaD n=1 Tax=Ningiella ruwaisensis TaxID=2364274 RepID=UPI0010A09004|nr:1,2-phenylacetyl-CoA epoxidase subunit PaaD [Ningiella ruwaisensis]
MQIITTVPYLRHERQVQRDSSDYPHIWTLLDEIADPEIPVLSIWDIGILTNVVMKASKVLVTITPTYSGCPAMDTIKEDIITHLQSNGYLDVEVNVSLSPAWTTENMTKAGQDKLREYGIAPPIDAPSGCIKQFTPTEGVKCPHCASTNTLVISEFGSTACKALFKCQDCQEPFDFFKSL